MSLFDKFQPIIDIRAELDAAGIMPFGAVTEKILSATEAIVNGHRVILAGTNNYLGLTFEPECIEAATRAVREQGTGTTGSRMANGTFAEHVSLERELATFFARRHAIVFSTGYAATMGMGSTLAGRGDVIVMDTDSHASIYDGVRLGGADVVRFKHNDAADLEKRLRRLGERTANTLIIIEGIYSMLGDQAPLADIAATLERLKEQGKIQHYGVSNHTVEQLRARGLEVPVNQPGVDVMVLSTVVEVLLREKGYMPVPAEYVEDALGQWCGESSCDSESEIVLVGAALGADGVVVVDVVVVVVAAATVVGGEVVEQFNRATVGLPAAVGQQRPVEIGSQYAHRWTPCHPFLA